MSDFRLPLNTLRSLIILLIAAFTLLAPAWVDAGPLSTVESYLLLRPGRIAVTDFDGDNIIDIASGVKMARTGQSYAYRVELRLSNWPKSDSFTVYSNEPTGLNIQAIDVD